MLIPRISVSQHHCCSVSWPIFERWESFGLRFGIKALGALIAKVSNLLDVHKEQIDVSDPLKSFGVQSLAAVEHPILRH